MYNKQSNYNKENGFIEILAISGHKKKTESSNFNTDNYTNGCWLHGYIHYCLTKIVIHCMLNFQKSPPVLVLNLTSES